MQQFVYILNKYELSLYKQKNIYLLKVLFYEDYILVVKFMGVIMSTSTKISRGDFVREGRILSVSRISAIESFNLCRSICNVSVANRVDRVQTVIIVAV